MNDKKTDILLAARKLFSEKLFVRFDAGDRRGVQSLQSVFI